MTSEFPDKQQRKIHRPIEQVEVWGKTPKSHFNQIYQIKPTTQCL